MYLCGDQNAIQVDNAAIISKIGYSNDHEFCTSSGNSEEWLGITTAAEIPN